MKYLLCVLVTAAGVWWGTTRHYAAERATAERSAQVWQDAALDLTATLAERDSTHRARAARDSADVAHWQAVAEANAAEAARYRAAARDDDRARAEADARMVSAETSADSLAAALDALTACDRGRDACEELLASAERHGCEHRRGARRARSGHQ